MAGTDETHFNPGGALTRRMTASWAGESEGDPAEAITREELAVLLWQAAGAPDNGAELPFADADKVSPEAVQAAAWANAEGLITGKPNARLDPGAPVLRFCQKAALWTPPSGPTALPPWRTGACW